MFVYHITLESRWNEALSLGSYAAPSLVTEGFIHCSTAAQVERSLNRFYANEPEVLLLAIDPGRLTSELKYEPAHGEMFPHIYGEIDLDAVVATTRLSAEEGGGYRFDPAGNEAGGKKIRIAVLYGGRSGEHEVSLQSAASVIANLDPERFDILPIGIDKEGRWHMNDLSLMPKDGGKVLPVFKDAPVVVLPPYSGSDGVALVPFGGDGGGEGIDVVFPVMHGPLCEDGSVQGLFELADVPYVGSGVLASAIGMDKDVAKRLAAAAGLPVAPYLAMKRDRWKRVQDNLEELYLMIESRLGYPVFVKPANMGSSVGVHKVIERSGLKDAIDDAFRYDVKVLIEQGIDAREIELSVLENIDPVGEPLVSVPGEIAPTHDFYSYEAKYLDENGAALIIPSQITPEQEERAREIARESFLALECEGMARVDLFLDRTTGELYFNEVNTLPGFTTISMYPKLWEASGISYRDLLSRLVELAIARHERKKGLVREHS